MAELEDKVAIITGGASGIGAATVRLFVEEGARVVIADMQCERGEALAAELGTAAIFVNCEVRQEDQVKIAVDTAVGRCGRLDCIFNNAGFGGALGPIEDIATEEFDLTFDVLVRGVFLGMKHAVPALRERGRRFDHQHRLDRRSDRGPGANHLFCCQGRCHSLDQSGCDATRTRFNPGQLHLPGRHRDTACRQHGWPARFTHRGSHLRLRCPSTNTRAGLPDDIAQMALFLASDRSSFITGQAIVVDGGGATGVMWSDREASLQDPSADQGLQP